MTNSLLVLYTPIRLWTLNGRYIKPSVASTDDSLTGKQWLSLHRLVELNILPTSNPITSLPCQNRVGLGRQLPLSTFSVVLNLIRYCPQPVYASQTSHGMSLYTRFLPQLVYTASKAITSESGKSSDSTGKPPVISLMCEFVAHTKTPIADFSPMISI